MMQAQGYDKHEKTDLSFCTAQVTLNDMNTQCRIIYVTHILLEG